MTHVPIYIECCNQTSVLSYPFFIKKLIEIQELVTCAKSIKVPLSRIGVPSCSKCNTVKYYQISNIIWPDVIEHIMNEHLMYPSEYFIKVIICIQIINGHIINPPIYLFPQQRETFSYVPLHYNKLLILDALMHQGSHPKYELLKHKKIKYIYSEHSGVLTLKNKVIENIIVSAQTNRLDINDDNIYLPINSEIFLDHEYIFHTHPNTSKYGGRIKDGIIYEFPSANDIMNFVKYYQNGIALASIIISPEGIYVIRPISYQKINIDVQKFHDLQKFIIELEKKAIAMLDHRIENISDENRFHKYVSYNFTFIDLLNQFIQPFNLFIEFYPRIKKNGEWNLPQINLAYIENASQFIIKKE